jgi:hypothetical protein
MAKARSNGSGRMPIYKSYVFRDKDPVIDEMRTLIESHYGDRLNSKSIRKITEGGGPSTTCMSGWFYRTTKRPQNATIEAAGRAMGYRRKWVKEK